MKLKLWSLCSLFFLLSVYSYSQQGFVKQFGVDQAFGGNLFLTPWCTVDKSDNIILAGGFKTNPWVAADLDPGPGTFLLNAQFLEDAFLSKLDSTGMLQWAIHLMVDVYLQAKE